VQSRETERKERGMVHKHIQEMEMFTAQTWGEREEAVV
jgi:hypothetical protein